MLIVSAGAKKDCAGMEGKNIDKNGAVKIKTKSMKEGIILW
jgi:hypothetical protein